jgi:hypothetical protein
VYDENSVSRERRAAQCAMDSKERALSVLGDAADEKYPIFMTGDHLCLCVTSLCRPGNTDKMSKFATKK